MEWIIIARYILWTLRDDRKCSYLREWVIIICLLRISAVISNERMAITRKIVANHFANVFSDACKFAFYVHASTCMYIHPAPSPRRPDENVWWNAAPMRKRVFNVYFRITFAGVRRPKWAFERWFIIRVAARTKSPTRFHCPRIFFFFQTAENRAAHPLASLSNVLMANEEKRRETAFSRFGDSLTFNRHQISAILHFARILLLRELDRVSFSFIMHKKCRQRGNRVSVRNGRRPHAMVSSYIFYVSTDFANIRRLSGNYGPNYELWDVTY